jgi:putative nucleotidyltransferase with HDIG domain
VALRAVLTLPSVEPLWPHSLDTADMSCQLAARSGVVETGQAYLCGLLHDVGRIALEAVPLYDSARLFGFIRAGCPRVYAENLLLRTDHGTLGAHIARYWRLPEPLVEAIQHHHRPEAVQNPLASVLYLGEFLTGGEEDLPSRYRLNVALRRLNLAEADAHACRTSAVCQWLAA